jgi:hypothetical protein
VFVETLFSCFSDQTNISRKGYEEGTFPSESISTEKEGFTKEERKRTFKKR